MWWNTLQSTDRLKLSVCGLATVFLFFLMKEHFSSKEETKKQTAGSPDTELHIKSLFFFLMRVQYNWLQCYMHFSMVVWESFKRKNFTCKSDTTQFYIHSIYMMLSQCTEWYHIHKLRFVTGLFVIIKAGVHSEISGCLNVPSCQFSSWDKEIALPLRQ